MKIKKKRHLMIKLNIKGVQKYQTVGPQYVFLCHTHVVRGSPHLYAIIQAVDGDIDIY